ncbi:hypothetical protein OTU49_004347 [Cherax quadricarinatus]|uniref:hydroxymethylbilane synthase n=1 Tax=Cherax quadricarinatus TaxID=27406 RepID=A0AAW0XEP3_CHEQU
MLSSCIPSTSSLRRSAQLKRKYPDLCFKSVRGNLNTRFRKLDDADDYAALVLAAAGVIRMGWKNRISQYLCDDLCMYAVGQGALAVECREGDSAILDILAKIADPDTTVEAVAERAFMRTLEGGCSAPVAVHTKVMEDSLTLKGGVWSLDGSEELVHTMTILTREPDTSSDSLRPPKKIAKTCITFCGIVPLPEQKDVMTRANQLGKSLAQTLLDKGADQILKAAKAQNTVNSPPSVSSTSNGNIEDKKALPVNTS